MASSEEAKRSRRHDASRRGRRLHQAAANRSRRSRTASSNGAQAVIIGAISFDGLNNLVKRNRRKKNIPVIDVINGMSSPDLSAKSLVSFETMGYKAGEYIAKLHPAGFGRGRRSAWFPGPPGAGWVEAGNKGFLDAIKGSALEVVDTKYGDTGKEVQLKLVEDVLQANPNIKYIAGTSPTTEAAVQLAARAQPVGQDQGHRLLLHARASTRTSRPRRVMAAPTDSAVVQGRVSDRPGGAHPRRQALSQACRPEDLRDRQVEHQYRSTTLVAGAGRLKPVFSVN